MTVKKGANMLSLHNNYPRVIRVETHKSFLWHAHTYTYTITWTSASTAIHRHKPGPGCHTNTQTNALSGGSNYVKWLVLITLLCLRGDYEHINQRHVCQSDVSSPGRTNDWGQWARWEVQEMNTQEGREVFVFFLFSATSKTKFTPLRVEIAKTMKSVMRAAVQIFKHQPPVAL